MQTLTIAWSLTGTWFVDGPLDSVVSGSSVASSSCGNVKCCREIMDIEVLLYIGGIYHIGWALFDLFWPKIFNWKETLADLDDLNRVLLPITSKLLVVLWLTIAYLSFFQSTELLTTTIGSTILIFVSICWFVRAIMQIYYFGFKKANEFNVVILPQIPFSNRTKSIIGLIYFFFGISFYLIPLIYSKY